MHRPRVVIESRRADAAQAQAEVLAQAGLDPVICAGPAEHGAGCPLLEGQPCDLVEDADAVLYDLDLEVLEDRQVLRALGARHPSLPIVTERTTAEVRRFDRDLGRCTVVVPFSSEHTRDAVVAALADVRGTAVEG